MKTSVLLSSPLLALALLAAPAHAADTLSSDEAITAKVEAALAADKRLQVKAPLEVRTREGVVEIIGDVKTAAMVYRAVETTRDIEGVKEVDTNRLDAR